MENFFPIKFNSKDISDVGIALLNKISNAIGAGFKPIQIKRIAKAQAEANIILAQSNIEITEMEYRALSRLKAEETIKQKNIENIINYSIPLLQDTAKPDQIENDWIFYFLDKSKLVSDEDMQLLWSKILAGEANNPGSYSRRTINIVNSLDNTDAELFQSLMSYVWDFDELVLIIIDIKDPIYNQRYINYTNLSHLDEIGLISYERAGFIEKTELPQEFFASYYGQRIKIELNNPDNNIISIGKAVLSRSGRELASLCYEYPIPEFFNYSIEKWKKLNNVNISIL